MKKQYDFSWVDLELNIWKFKNPEAKFSDYEISQYISVYKRWGLAPANYDEYQEYSKQRNDYIQKFR